MKMIPLSEAVWEDEAAMVSNRVHIKARPHSDYFIATCDNVEDLCDPDTPSEPLTRSALVAWEERCMKAAKEDLDDTPHQPRTINPQNRDVPNASA